MLRPLAVVVLLSRYRCSLVRTLFLVCVLVFHGVGFAVGGVAEIKTAGLDVHSQEKFVARIEAHSKDEMLEILRRSEAFVDDALADENFIPIELILHGDEILLFDIESYEKNKELVDLAAKLDSLNVINVKICNTWMLAHGLKESELPPFVNFVLYGPLEKWSKKRAGYIYF